jgi:hypothetical protein
MSKNFKKAIFLWVIFNSIGYLSYLFDIHPYFKIARGNYSHFKNYILTPVTNLEAEYFFPFHSFMDVEYDYGFKGIYGYYGNYEFFVYVIIPLIIIGSIWFYRKYVNK